MSKRNPKASKQDFKTRLIAHPIIQGVTAAVIAGAGNRVGEPRVDPTGTIQPFFDLTNAHPNLSPLAGLVIGGLTGAATAVGAQRRDAKAYHQQQNVVARTASLNPKILKNYKNPR